METSQKKETTIPEYSEDELRRVKALTIEAVENLALDNSAEARAGTEIMLEMADENLDILISRREYRLLVYFYMKLKAIRPFSELRELLTDDAGAELFFMDVREVLRIENLTDRAQAWTDTFRGFPAYLRSGVADVTEWSIEIATLCHSFLLQKYHTELLHHHLKNPKPSLWKN